MQYSGEQYLGYSSGPVSLILDLYLSSLLVPLEIQRVQRYHIITMDFEYLRSKYIIWAT